MKRPLMIPSNIKADRSKLETHIDLLKAFSYEASLTLTQIEDYVKLNSNSLRENLEFLILHGLLEEQTLKKRNVAFAITQRGIAVLRYFRQYPVEISVKKV
jgi:predicted transcriptional regulator